jgi:VanZ family protein
LRCRIDRLPAKALFLSVLAGITLLALMPWSGALPGPFHWSDKLNHFAAFVLLTLLLLNAYRIDRLRSVLWMILYGAVIEGIQAFLPWRSAEWSDLAVDALAALSGVWLWRPAMRFPPTERNG